MKIILTIFIIFSIIATTGLVLEFTQQKTEPTTDATIQLQDTTIQQETYRHKQIITRRSKI